jgi:hypothetical protein
MAISIFFFDRTVLIVEHLHITDAHISANEKHLTAFFFTKSVWPFYWWLGIFRSGNYKNVKPMKHLDAE